MADEYNNDGDRVTLCATKAGNGYKVVHNGIWFYASKRQLMELIAGKQRACTFTTIKDEVAPVQ